MTDKTTLLPCPICGGNMREPITKRWTNCLGDISYSAWIKCWNCKLTLETDSCGYETEEAAENAVITAWNTRATHSALTAEQVREAVEASTWAETSTIREFNDSSWQAIADELNAKLGSGTCEVECFDDGVDEGMDGEWFSYSPPTWYLSCGHTAQGTEKPNFCPVCGKAVKR